MNILRTVDEVGVVVGFRFHYGLVCFEPLSIKKKKYFYDGYFASQIIV